MYCCCDVTIFTSEFHRLRAKTMRGHKHPEPWFGIVRPLVTRLSGFLNLYNDC